MAPRRARIVLADQQVLFRQSLSAHLAKGGYAVVEASNGAELDQCMIEGEPDILIIDRYLPGVEALEYCQMQNALQPQLQILLLVAYEHEASTLQAAAFIAGAAGCLSKDLEPQAYLAAMRRLAEGDVLFHANVMRRAARPQIVSGPAARLPELTSRELEILELVAEGLGNRDIAERLAISYHTVMKHVSNIISKLKVNNRMEAGLTYIRYGQKGARPGLRHEDGE
jgi:two-component system, NarL family, nitrate/nitrite response regulator NarL